MKIDKFKVLSSAIAVFFGFLIGAIIIGLIGIGNPDMNFTTLFSKFYEATIQGVFTGDLSKTGDWLMISSIIILTGLSVAFAYKGNIFNIGAEGQFVAGAFCATIAGITLNLPTGIHAIVALLIGILAGSLYALIPGILKAYYNVSEVVVTIMLNWIAVYYTSYLVTDFFAGDYSDKTNNIKESASIISPYLSDIFNTRIYYGFIVAIIALVIYYIILNKTKYGYELKAVGYNVNAANYAGIKTKRKIMSTFMISGAFSGAAGAIYALGAVDFFAASTTFLNYGFDGITVAFLGQMSTFGMIISSLLLAGFRSTGRIFVGNYKEIIDVVIGIILIFSVLGPHVLNKIRGGRK